MKIAVLDGYGVNPGDLSWDWLRDYGEVDVYKNTSEEQLLERAQGCEILLLNKCPLNATLLRQLPSLRFINLLATGFNNVDIDHCRNHGIVVSNAPAYGIQAVAQMTFALLLELTNQVGRHDRLVKGEGWRESIRTCYRENTQLELTGKTLGIVGFGRIGRQVANIASAFGMKLLVYTPRPDPALEGEGLRFVLLEELARESDVVSFHCPLTPATQGMANEAFFALMKPTALLINTARGGILEESALLQALTNGVIAGAGLDVLSVEPPVQENPLMGHDNCIITPHIAWAGRETRIRLMTEVKENLDAFLKGTPLNNVAAI